jgi:hypothetical protein
MAAAPMKAETLPKAVTGTQEIQPQTLMPMLKLDIITLTIQDFPVGTSEIMPMFIPTPPCRRLTVRLTPHAHHRPHPTS